MKSGSPIKKDSTFLLLISFVFVSLAGLLTVVHVFAVYHQKTQQLAVYDRNKSLRVEQLIPQKQIQEIIKKVIPSPSKYFESDVSKVANIRVWDLLRDTVPKEIRMLVGHSVSGQNTEYANIMHEDLKNQTRQISENLFSDFPERNEVCSLRFFYVWFSPDSSFKLIYQRSMESVFMAHPNACIFIYSDTLSEARFTRFHAAGYTLKVMPLYATMNQLIQGTPLETWWQKRQFYETEPYWVNNLSNAFRLLVLYEFGGVWLDTDVIILNNFENLRNALGVETGDLSRPQSIQLNGAVMVFKKHATILWRIMEEFVRSFNGLVWGHNCPRLMTKVALSVPQDLRGKATIEILPRSAFYPIHFYSIAQYFDFKWLDQDKHGKLWKELRLNSYCFHWWHHFVAKKKLQKGTVLFRALNELCLFCNETITTI
eukprot:TRINITY_DN4858_c0_g1_i5.p1 TRINITY_DN4858_c0_g1~~TRINITY_DN4858_c0_g1_i5.p1  ORF type:complete len:428 (-),score=14.72 TRINITY_DN4858_c0_g1_i5:105-1388(-)